MKKMILETILYHISFNAKENDVKDAIDNLWFYLRTNNNTQYNFWVSYHKDTIAKEFPLLAKML